MVKRLSHVALATVLIAAAGLAPLVRGAVRGDTNGDFAVDVLDLQHVIAEVLGRDAAQEHGDVNHDGVVNVLDFQTLLSEAQQANSTDSAPAPHNDQNTPTHTRSVNEIVLRVAFVKPVSPEEGKSASSFAARPALYTHVASPKVERHIQHLSPNAPPVVG